MSDERVRWSVMQGAPGEEGGVCEGSAMLLQEQLVRQAQDTLVAARDANAAAAEKQGRERASARKHPAPFPPDTDPDGPDDPDDPENRVMNPGAGVGAYASLLVPAEKPTKPPEEAIADLLDRMKAYKRALHAILNACREESTTAEVDAALEPEYEFCACAYSPISLRKMLVEAGALAYLDPADAEEEGSLEAPGPVGPNEGDGLEHGEAGGEVVEDERLRGSVYDQDGYLVIEEEREGTWVTTEAGLAYLEEADPEKEFRAQVAKLSEVEDVFYEVLAYCEQGRDIVDIVKHFENDERLGAHTFYASHIVDKLEQSGALAWRRKWITTEVGKRLLAEKRGK